MNIKILLYFCFSLSFWKIKDWGMGIVARDGFLNVYIRASLRGRWISWKQVRKGKSDIKPRLFINFAINLMLYKRVLRKKMNTIKIFYYAWTSLGWIEKVWNQRIQKYQAEKTDPVKFALENNVNMTCCLNLGYSVSLEDLPDGKKEASLQSHKCYSKGYI